MWKNYFFETSAIPWFGSSSFWLLISHTITTVSSRNFTLRSCNSYHIQMRTLSIHHHNAASPEDRKARVLSVVQNHPGNQLGQGHCMRVEVRNNIN